jgi:signal transduction histidine kinase
VLTTFPGDLADAEPSFGAYAAHELRVEITVQLALAEATLADPDADQAALRALGQQVVASCQRQQRLLEALLTLARGDSRDLRREPVDLAKTVDTVLRAQDHRPLRTSTALQRARTTGDPWLIERLVANLISNAVRHNRSGGRINVATQTTAGRATLTIANTGPVVPAGELTRLFKPFERLNAPRRPASNGLGLGLAIVQAIATAHDATVNATARTGGGLTIDINFPAAT